MEGQRFLTVPNPGKRIDSRDKGCSRNIFLQRNKKIFCKALIN